ncbi:MAG: WG repeat-containing protein [Clostridia bacterium]|nr:WG repeat-containing protein [Clostridia bacterium]
MKKIIAFFVVLAVLFSYTTVACADDDYPTVDVYINGEKLYTDQPAIIYQDRTLVPLRAICEALKCDVDWNGETQTITIQNELTIVNATIGAYQLKMKDRRAENGDGAQQETPIDVPPMIMNGRTLVPARAISEALNADVGWDPDTGTVAITMEYDAIGIFRGNLASVKKDGKGGLINKKGEIVVPLVYDYVGEYDTNVGLVIVKNNGKAGCLNERGEVVVSLAYDEVFSFINGWAQVWKDGKKGLVNKEGYLAVPPVYDSVYGFDEGFAIVEKDWKYGFVNTAGEIVASPVYDNAYDFREGLAPVKKDGKWGYINTKGEVVIPLVYDNIWRFRDGLAQVQKDGKYGYINKEGEVVVPIASDSGSEAGDGLGGNTDLDDLKKALAELHAFNN